MRDAFYVEFFTDMFPKVHRFIRARFPSGLAEDLASETMLTVWRKRVPVPSDDVGLRQLRTLTYKIALGHISNAERKRARESDVLHQGMLRVTPEADPTYEAVVPVVLAEAVARLDSNDRQGVHLMIAGFRTAEIAVILGISEKAASMRLARARKRLGRRLVEGEKNVADDASA
ncbi:RNA polymerase sigma factor [Streptomyces rubiginosohelvolus]|uniref:RNA polymerase sigma factor n=1 Tax=Streptomyces rubiginosohelvolus TaxID=67362 RepID=UPI00364FAFF7